MIVPTFGDNVCVADTPLTRQIGFAGKHGVGYGFTTPSVTNIKFIGTSAQDLALNIHFPDRNEAFWFVPELVQFIDHGAGMEITTEGSGKRGCGGKTEAGMSD